MIAFKPDTQSEFEWLLTRYPTKRAALLPTLRLVERDFGEVSTEGLQYVAKLLDMSPATVYGVFTFYTHFRRPGTGMYHLQVCATLPCALCGGREIVKHLEKRLGIRCGQSTKDGRFTLSKVECLASCGTGPVVQVNDDYVEDLTIEKLDQLIDRLEKR